MNRRRVSFLSNGVSHQAKRQKASTRGFENEVLYDRYTVAWICALHIEMAAARAMLDEEHDDLPRRGNDTNSYVLGAMQEHNIVIACLPADQYGTNNAANVLSNMKNTFPKIRIGLMVGIGGGVPTKADIRLGDIVVGVRVMQSDLGKTVNGTLQRTAVPKIPDSSIRTVISNLRARHELNCSRVPLILKDKMRKYPAYCLPDEPDRLFQPSYSHENTASSCDECDQSKLQARKIRSSTNPVIHYGAIASGNQVMKDASCRDDIARELDVICFEMEAAGLMDIMPCLPIRGICDYSDSHKAKGWQRYAAATAAAYAYEFLGVWGGDTLPVEAGYPLRQTENCPSTERRVKLLGALDFKHKDSRKTTIKAAYSKTCQWFLSHPDYLAWTNQHEVSRHHGFLWIKGSFFFNARGVELEKTVSGMFRSLLLQLLVEFPDLQCVLDDPELVSPSQESCPSLDNLKELLRRATLKLDQRSFTCFIDALDECDEQQVMDLIEYFEELAEQCTENGVRLQICFSSRHYPFIDIRLGLCLILEDQVGHTSDLETYIKTHLRVGDTKLLAELQNTMLEKAAGVFMWVVLVVDVLNRENRRGRLSLRTRLEEVPSGLSELFKDLLRRDKTNMEELLLSVLWTLLSKRPLTPGEYYHALWSGLSLEGLADLDPPNIDTSDADDCFDRCVISSSKGLSEITRAEDPIVQFIHESVRDFLIKDKGLHGLWPELGADWESSGHERLKLCCHSYLELVRTQARLSQLDVDKETYPFLEYASQFVLHHAEHAGNAVSQEAFLTNFPTPVWISMVNIFEKFKVRRFTPDATLAYVLAERGHPGLIQTLRRAKPDLNIDDPVDKERYRYPLIAAMAKGNKSSVIAILDLSSPIFDGTDITETLTGDIDAGGTDRTPMSWACEQGHLGIVKVLISRPDYKQKDLDRSWTPLILASKNGNIDIVKVLIEDGVNIDRTVKNENAISFASKKGHVGIVRALLDAGADPNFSVVNDTSLLYIATKNGHLGIVRALLDAGADPHFSDVNDTSLLHIATGQGHEEVVKLLLEGGVNVNRANYADSRPLHFSARRQGSVTVMKELLRYGADIHAQDKRGETCLMEAAEVATSKEIEFLVKNGADVNARDHRGRTCAHRMCLRGLSLFSFDHHLLDILQVFKVDFNARDDRGDTPLHLLCGNFSATTQSFVQFLSQPGIDLNAQNHKGETPLHCASELSRYHFYLVVEILIKFGADVNVVNNKGQTPLDVATGTSVADLLVKNGGIRRTT
ncbi:hypothetical protein FLONG3_7930 [Fusarium longipes]|uniref:Uncharacterized protein n=1 Tax=Fusarium longipes TaxID=694270 RepID=A0A395SA81_9HYPO|nr:hypothetical protein FLONG3_7930 [Fusarium longipes]